MKRPPVLETASRLVRIVREHQARVGARSTRRDGHNSGVFRIQEVRTLVLGLYDVAQEGSDDSM